MASYKVVDHKFYKLIRVRMEPARLEMACAICLKEVTRTPLRKRFFKKLSCGHHFHADCVNKWLSNNFSCPICRFNNYTLIDSLPTGNRYAIDPHQSGHHYNISTLQYEF
jgi:hypothetical protein